MTINLKGMTRGELTSLGKRVDSALAKLDKADKKKALAAAEAAAKQHGFSLAQLAGVKSATKAAKKSGPKSPAKYANPENPSVTWTGKGRRPDWIRAGLKAGKTLEDFAIR